MELLINNKSEETSKKLSFPLDVSKFESFIEY